MRGFISLHPRNMAVIIDPELLEILVCPETRQALTMATDEMLDRVNAAVGEGNAVTRGGEAVTEAVTAGLVRADGIVLYPIREGIPIMLIDESIKVAGL